MTRWILVNSIEFTEWYGVIMYSATEWSKYIVWKCINDGMPISYDTTYEEWQEYLLKIARLIRESVEDSPEIDKKIEEMSNESNMSGSHVVFKKNYEELLKEAEREEEIKKAKRQTAFKMLTERFESLWD